MTNEEAKDYIKEWCPYDRQEEIIKALSNSDLKYYPFCEDCHTKMDEIRRAYDCMQNKSDIKEIYDKGYKDGQEALAYHIKLCKDEGSIIIVPKRSTNGEIVMAMFPDAEVIAVENEEMEIVEYVVKIDIETAFTAEWWNAPYREEK